MTYSVETSISVMRIQEASSKTLTGHSQTIRQSVFLSDYRLVSCSDDGTIKVWETASGKELFTLQPHTYAVFSIAILPNGWLASGSDDSTIKLWDMEEKREVRTLRGHTRGVVSLKVLSNGNIASYSIDDTIKIWNPSLAENNLLATISGHGNTKWVSPLGILPNDNLVTLTVDADKKEECILRVWNPNDGQLVKSLPTGLKDAWLVLALLNEQIAIGSLDGTIKIFDLDDESKTITKEKAHGGVTSLLELSNGNLVSAGGDLESASFIFSIKVWDISDMSLLQHLKPDHSQIISSLSISEDGKMLASGSIDESIKLWQINIIDGNETSSQSS